MLFDIPFIADWGKIGDRRQLLTDRGNQQENAKRIDYDYKVGDKVLVINEGILRKAESTNCYPRYVDKISSITILPLLSSIPCHWIGTMGRCQVIRLL